MRPGALVMRIVVAPHQAVHDAVALGQVEAGRIFLERGEAVQAEVLAGQLGELWPHPEVVLLVGFVHRAEQPGNPADYSCDRRDAAGGETIETHRLATGSMVVESECET